jgi:hypothetical protein
MLRKNDLPQKTWSLDQLKTWLQAACKRWALDAYWMGLALLYSRDQLKEEGIWMEFCREACPGFSYETIQRYIRLAKAVKDPEKLEGIRLNQAYELTGIVQAKKKPEAKPNQPHTTPGKPRGPSKNDTTEDQTDVDDPAEDPSLHQRSQSRPGMHLAFFAVKVVEQLTAVQSLPKNERWQDLDLETIRSHLLELQEQVAKALKDLPKTRRKAS